MKIFLLFVSCFIGSTLEGCQKLERPNLTDLFNRIDADAERLTFVQASERYKRHQELIKELDAQAQKKLDAKTRTAKCVTFVKEDNL